MVEFVLWVSKDCSPWLLSWHGSDIHWLGLGTYWRKASARPDWVSDRWRRTETEIERQRKKRGMRRGGAVARLALHTSMNSSTSIPDRMRNTVSWPWLIKRGKKQRGFSPPTRSHTKVTEKYQKVEDERTFVLLTFHFVTFLKPDCRENKTFSPQTPAGFRRTQKAAVLISEKATEQDSLDGK